MLIFFVNIALRLHRRQARRAANYWGEGATTLEWTLSSPPPFHQFETLPVIEDHHHRTHDHIGPAGGSGALRRAWSARAVSQALRTLGPTPPAGGRR